MQILDLQPMFKKMEKKFTDDLNFIKFYKNQLTFHIISIGDDKASSVYIQKKKELFEKFGIHVYIHRFNGKVDQLDKVLELMNRLNDSNQPYILQLPLPEVYKHYEELLLSNIKQECDADGFNINCRDLNRCTYPFSATAKGVLSILRSSNIDVEGKDILIIGRSHLVGQPLAIKLMHFGATVTVAHTKTKNLNDKIKNSDIIISCAGAPIIKKEYVKDNAVLIGVGFHYKDGKQYQDFDLDDLSDVNCIATNRINATGKATVYSLLDNYITLMLLY